MYLKHQRGGAMKPAEVLARYGAKLHARLITDRSYKAESEQSEGLSAIPDKFLQADHRGKHLEWLVRSYIEGGIALYEDLITQAKPALADFNKLINARKLSKGTPGRPWEDETVLDNYCGLRGCTVKGRIKPGLISILNEHRDFLAVVDEGAERGHARITEGETVRLIVPLDMAAAIYYGQGTRWCTAAREENYFDGYNELGPLTIIIPRKPVYKGEKYQFHSPTFSFMNESDYPIFLFGLYNAYPELHKLLPLDTLGLPQVGPLMFLADELSVEFPYIYVISTDGRPPIFLSTEGAYQNTLSKYDYAEHMHLDDNLPSVDVATEYPELLSPEMAAAAMRISRDHLEENRAIMLVLMEYYKYDPNYLSKSDLDHLRKDGHYKFMNTWEARVKPARRNTVRPKSA